MSVTTITSRADAKNFRKMFREFLHSSFDITDDIIMDRLFSVATIMFTVIYMYVQDLQVFQL